MTISYNWLKKYINTDLSPEEVGKLLTEAGLEVEHIEPYESFKGGLKGLLVGEVKTCIKHPNADKLSLTTIDVGGEKILNIVCGAPNVAAGQKVIVAVEGTLLYPSEREPFTIKKSKIRGEFSEGMICAEDEIGLGKSHAGVMVLPAETKIGLPASEYFQIYNDSVFEIGVTPNRADALSHIGVARDLVAAINIHSNGVEKPKLEVPSLQGTKQSHPNEIIVSVENPEACKRYTGAEIKGIEVKESPQWLKNYLSAIGLRPINNIVDITNFVMFETGQPLHAFDADKIKGNRVVVRKAKAGETIVTLDGTERKLKAEDLLICDGGDGINDASVMIATKSVAMCIAGVYGGKESGVTESTKNIFLESACFDSVHIRRTARTHGLHTDASFRFERGTDANITGYALMRAINLMHEVNPTIVVSEIQDVYPEKVEEKKFDFSISYANRLAGHAIPEDKIAEILKAVGIKIMEKNEDNWQLSIPTNRLDITCPADIVEEILRFYGYNNIPIPTKLNIPLVHSGAKKPEKIICKVGDYLSSLGFLEIMNTSLSSSKFEEGDNVVKMANPLSSDLDIMRGSLLFNGLTSISLNQNNQSPDLKFYEFGRTYHKKPDGKFKETEHLALWVCGDKITPNWNSKPEPADYFTLKLYVNAVIGKVAGAASFVESTVENDAVLSYGYSITANSGELVKFGKVKEEILKKFGIKGEVFYADFNWKILLQQIPKGLEVTEIVKFPYVSRDLALIIDKEVQFSTLKDMAYKTEKEILKGVSVFDVYEGKGVEEGKKSYALRFILQSDSKTLSDKEIEKVMEKLTKVFSEKTGAIIRSS